MNTVAVNWNGALGCYMSGLCANAFIYADDIIILTPTCYALRRLIVICEGFSEEFSLSFDPDKSAILLFSGVTFIGDIRLTFFGRNIKIVLEEKHLGHVLSSRGSLVNIDTVINDMKVRTDIILNQLYSIVHHLHQKYNCSIANVCLFTARNCGISVTPK